MSCHVYTYLEVHAYTERYIHAYSRNMHIDTHVHTDKVHTWYNISGEKYFGNRVTHIFPLKINIKGKIPY